MINKIIRKIRSYSLSKKGAKLSDTIQSKGNFFEGNPKGLKCGKAIYLMEGVKMIVDNKSNVPQLIIGDYFFMNCYSIIDCHFNITIGKRVLIGPHCYIADFDHDMHVNIHQPLHRANESCEAVVIKDNVWLGAGVTVLKGVTIGKNSVIAAGSVVITDIPDNVVAAGVPAKIKRIIENNVDE